MTELMKRRARAALNGAARVIDVAAAQYQDPRRYTARVAAIGASKALAGDVAVLAQDGARAAAKFQAKK